ncbi:hypothetical protein A2697_05035 [Candidatus Curtissbacteria bacterium RIFCSPHIGHO2_01_FULL_41_44]|uniref:ASCH domain-containing protein n=1 Tax=Candidatus Curtissbacteria bacterium RIFCSPLOWO2_01_FULL_42_50 TaxID=1797730 RepID=A0A1F5H5N7_9BACT|nr:MAG: hypothetical protein A2697_05035 [Candidatus Curtissbacteria bacterium RIFCSPHIGHO2_01_FULL_41_44]OGD93800.1 MAG: hypothetical protein A3C33_03680 [Candidatus Curtissbacteria bacterium RIFCSPHIGHO2_02_FULL_42_58]OGD97807.1 MAG: hypothetical protein A3E71_01120 [Candidatus Curtissbacteria bacterium RIFCSPHIGHO2_12_FULL_42_33]OGD99440.1 MAG: hypothetical protein A3B54_00910 [Candidatus Curtissbacteria bacterium RIFCSPLOWO2_01_FULL_42_50]OGE11723.1 MAG: hypothetical protein A3H87_03930 [Ca
MIRHLAIFDQETVKRIFEGKKKTEGRFSKNKIPPFGKASRGDTVLVKVSGEKIVGQFTVDRVIYYDHPTSIELDGIKKKYGKELALPKTFWLDHEKVNYVTLMFIGAVTKFIIPPQIAKRDLRPWVVLG